MSTAASVEPATLLEREEAVRALEAELATTDSGRGRVVFVSGEAGVGKTALVQRFSDMSREHARVLIGACDPLFTPRPLGPFADVAATVGGELLELVENGGIPYRIASALLNELLERPPTVLVLEDVHWADEASLDVLRLVARRISDVPALMIATYRDDELDPDHPLRVVLGGLASVREVRRLPLLPLSAAAVAELAEPFGADPQDLYRLTSGNPFYVTEVLAGGSRQIPETVRDAVRARITGLSHGASSVLEAASILPTGAQPWLVEALVGSVEGSLAECLSSGVLVAEGEAIMFRHELARLTVEESLLPDRRIALHRSALAALRGRPSARRDVARLVHHADAAGDGAAVLELAPEAAAVASSLGAHREAAAQYRRALRYADGLPTVERARLLERYSIECYLTDESDEAIDALRAARQAFHQVEDLPAEGRTLTRISNILWCPGRPGEAKVVGAEAVELLEALPPGTELARAYDNMAGLYRLSGELDEARVWSDRAVDAAERLGDRGTLAYVSGGAVLTEVMGGEPEALEGFDRRMRDRLDQGREDDAASMLEGLVLVLVFRNPHSRARRYIEDAVRYARAQGLDLAHLYALAHRSRLELEEGRWDDAAETAELVLGERFVSTYPRTLALSVLGLVRARRGDPDVWEALDRALELSAPTGEIPRIAPVAAARGEAAWLAGKPERVAVETDDAFRLALERGAPRAIGELATVRRMAGIEDELPDDVLEPWRSGLRGEWPGAVAAWDGLGCPYEKALVLFESGEEEALRTAFDICNELGARPLATRVTRRLRELGVSVPRGPRPSTRGNRAGLTSRESEILELLAGGRRNAEIAEHLVVSRRTVDHHVSAILRKLGATTRGEAVAEAARLGLLEDR